MLSSSPPADRGPSPWAERPGGSPAPADSFTERIGRLHAELRREGVAFADMRRAEALELQFVGVPDLERGGAGRGGPVEIERLEGGPITARRVPPLPSGSSRFRYFLDGSQRTMLVWRIGLVPVAATIAAAAILVRDPGGNPTIAPGTLRLRHTWLIPRQTAEPDVRALLDRLDAQGMEVVDPLGDPELVPDGYEAVAGNYGRMVELAYVAARKVRGEVERDLLRDWRDHPARSADGWLVVDGRLGSDAPPQAVGLVKDLATQHLAGHEAATLFGLPPGHRTTAFRHRSAGTSRRGDAPDAERSQASTLWYLRFWDADGMDARHALVRVEAGPEVREQAQIDELSAWLMAERTPRATADARWATLLYPVHFLEQILKRRLAADTRGWPGGR